LDCISRQNPALCDIKVACVEAITYSGFRKVGIVIQPYLFNTTFLEWIKGFLSDGILFHSGDSPIVSERYLSKWWMTAIESCWKRFIGWQLPGIRIGFWYYRAECLLRRGIMTHS
jgi:hypothetical protein